MFLETLDSKLNFMLDESPASSIIPAMNKLPTETRVRILSMLCEGSSMRSISRVCDVSINTVAKLLADAGEACADFHHEMVHDVQAKRIQCDEIWSFTYAKARNVKTSKAAPIGSGDVWTWTSIDADSKLIVNWLVGDRDTRHAMAFVSDLSARLANRVQITTDGHKPYQVAIEAVFGRDVDYGIQIKKYGQEQHGGPKRYSPAHLISAERDLIIGSPDIDHVSTSYVERQNLTMRMGMRRFTRLTNAFSKKFENHCHAIALYFVWYNWIKLHKAHRMTPAMAAGLTDKLLTWEAVLEMVDKRERQRVIEKRQAMLEEAPQSN